MSAQAHRGTAQCITHTLPTVLEEPLAKAHCLSALLPSEPQRLKLNPSWQHIRAPEVNSTMQILLELMQPEPMLPSVHAPKLTRCL